MSAAPLQLDGNSSRWGVNLGTGLQMRDSLWDGLTDSYTGTPMGKFFLFLYSLMRAVYVLTIARAL